MANFTMDIADSQELAAVIKNDGFHPSDTGRTAQLKIEDAVTSNELGALLPVAITEVLIEAVDPLMALTPLLDRVQAQKGIQQYKMPALGTFSVERVGEGESYPEKRLNMGGSMSTATIDKWGVALAFTREAIEMSRWDIVNLHIREAGRAFGRRKETVVADHLRSMGQIIYDNVSPALSQRGPTTGRSQDLNANGTFTADDFLEMYTSALNTGFQPDLLIMNPRTYMMFVRDPVLRQLTFNAGAGQVFGSFTGDARNRNMLPGALGRATMTGANKNGALGTGNTGTAPTERDFAQTLTSSPSIPSYFPFQPRIVVSPYVYMDPATQLTDIMLCDSRALGALVVAEDLRMDEYGDPKVDINYMKFCERYGLMVYEEGLGIFVAKNVSVKQNFATMEPGRMVYAPGDLPAIGPLDTPAL